MLHRARRSASIVWIAVAAFGLVGGCASRSELARVEARSVDLISTVDRDLSKAKSDLAVAVLRYQNANDADKAALSSEVSALRTRIADLDRISATANEAKDIAVRARAEAASVRSAADESDARLAAAIKEALR